MREIKFRGRDGYGHWYHGDYLSWKIGVPQIRVCQGSYYETFGVDPDTVGQFTGLTDADGREIYEGDIVSWGDGTPATSVRWDEHYAYYVIMKSLILSHACKAVRVIGNVHDNPELLTDAKD